MNNKTRFLVWMAAFHAVLFCMAPVLGVKIGNLFGLKFVVGSALFGLSYLITDVINNNWGKAEARLVVVTSVAARLALYLIIMPVIVAIPTLKAPPNYNQIMWGAFRIFAAGEIATFFAQYFLEIPFFSWLRKSRSFASSYVISGLLNVAVASGVFSLIAFWGMPEFGSLVAGQWSFALIVRVGALPIAMGLNWFVARLLRSDESVAG